MHHLETRLAGAGCEPDPQTGAVTPPVHFSTTFEREPDGSYPRHYVYSRWDNPTRHLLEQTLADLEGGTSAAVFASGMAAAMAPLQCLKAGDHVVLADDVYHGVRYLFRNFLETLSYTEVNQTDLEAVRRAMRPETRLVWAESPSNPLVKVTDLSALAEIAHAGGVQLLVDGTWTTPVLQQPLALGADLVLHSVTKYLAGHSDVLCGVLIAREVDSVFERIRMLQMAAGPVAGPFDCWLALRGLRSLAARMRMHCANAQRVAEFLSNHPNVARVYYPGLPDDPGHEIARRQMRDFGGMLSFEIKGGEQEALALTGRLQLFRRATSLGGTESLIEHRASFESKPTSTPPALLRVSVGLEHIDDLLADLDQALS
jgi:cystathionine gamma-synthase